MGRHTKEWNEGYQAAIEAIKKAMQGGGENGGGQGSDSGLPDDMTPPPGNGSGSGSGSGKGDKQDKKSGSGSGSRTDVNNPNQGIVRAEDCSSNTKGIEDMPETPGGFFGKDEGDKLAQSEGYDKEGGSEGTVEQDWKETALKEANKLQAGTKAGNLKSVIEGLYKVTTDWKKALKYIVGRSINPADTRQAYANKNILISQDRIARTDKDKYDNMDYMVAAIDSSGSMSDDQLKMCLSEIYSIAMTKKPIKLVVIQCDTRIQEIKEYTSLAQLKKDIVHAHVKGRGGTDVRPIWDLLRNDKRYSRVKPDLVMIFTDGGLCHEQPKRDRKTMNSLCWCIIDNPGWNVAYPDTMTKMVHIKSADVR